MLLLVAGAVYAIPVLTVGPAFAVFPALTVLTAFTVFSALTFSPALTMAFHRATVTLRQLIGAERRNRSDQDYGNKGNLHPTTHSKLLIET